MSESETISKKLGHDDESGFYFSQELLGDNVTAAVNFDRLQKHPQLGYIIFEYLLCEEDQVVTPYSSHPCRYWKRNKNKFLSLWRAALDFGAKLYLVNYAKKGTKAENEILLIEVLDMDENGITEENVVQFTRESFAEWFVQLNKECLEDSEAIIRDIYSYKSVAEIGNYIVDYGKYNGKTLSEIVETDRQYLEWIIENKIKHYSIVQCYLEKIDEIGQ